MADIFKTLILPADVTPLAQEIAAILSPGGISMWITGLSPTGEEPATHFISTGFIQPEFAHMVPEQSWAHDEIGAWIKTNRESGNPVAVYEACTAADITVTLEEIEAIFAVADVTYQEPFVAMSRMGLVLVQSFESIQQYKPIN
jgi:hypothetical protein